MKSILKYGFVITAWLVGSEYSMAENMGDNFCAMGDCENGYGVLITEGYAYYGHFLDSRKHFWGCELFKNEQQLYCGNFSKGERHLFGVFTKYKSSSNSNASEEFFIGLYANGNRLENGIRASKPEYRATMEASFTVWSVESNYSTRYDGTGCVAGDCENGNGVFISDEYNYVYEGGMIEGKRYGWGCLQNVSDFGIIERVTCGNYLNNEIIYAGFFANLADGFENIHIGFYEEKWLQGIRVRKNDGGEIEYVPNDEYFTGPLYPNVDGSMCYMGACNSDGYSIVAESYDSYDNFTKSQIKVNLQAAGHFANGQLNGFACKYSDYPSQEVECGNFSDGEPEFFSFRRNGGGLLGLSMTIYSIDRRDLIDQGRTGLTFVGSGASIQFEYLEF